MPDGAAYCCVCGKKQTSEPRKALKRANGTGTVYKLQGRRRRPWVAAKNKIIIGYYEHKTDALEALECFSQKPISERYNMTFSEVFNEWKNEHYREVGKQAVYAYNRAYRAFSSLHNRKFRELRTSDFQNIIDSQTGLSRASLENYKLLLTQMSKWAIREEIISTSFASYVKLPKEQKKEKEIFSDEDIQKLETDGSEASMIVLMLIYTGMRINELFNLPLADYHITYVVGGEKTEAGRNRIIPIRPEGRPLFAYFANHATDERLISGYAGQRVSDNFRRRDYYPLLDRLGITRKSPHATRHTFASWAVKKSMQPEILQKILGHANYSTTAEIYIHSDAEQLIKAVEIE